MDCFRTLNCLNEEGLISDELKSSLMLSLRGIPDNSVDLLKIFVATQLLIMKKSAGHQVVPAQPISPQ